MDEPATLSVAAAARLLGLGRATAYRAAQRGDLPVIRIGGRILVLRLPLEQLLAGEREALPPDGGEGQGISGEHREGH